MTTYHRQQAILELLEQDVSLKVTELARTFGVSEGTIRNDLTLLAKQNLLTRVRGGAVLKNGRAAHPIAHRRAEIHAPEKERIARWAAELVSDGDVILLDASSTALYMVPFLLDRTNLTVVTNQLEVAKIMAGDPKRTVILLGGIVNTDGSAVGGSISQEILKDLHLNAAFISCAGYSADSGLTETDLEEATFKEQVIKSAAKVVVMMDSSKFGKAGLKPFASLAQIDHIVTDDGISAGTIQHLQEAKVGLTICSEHTVQSLSPHDQKTRHYKIGFANLSEQVPFAVDVRRGLERAAKRHSNLDLLIADNDLNSDKAVQIADQFIKQQVDLVIEYQIDEVVGNLVMDRFREKGIPVIAVDIPMVGANFFGVNNYQTGLVAGKALGSWIKSHWQGEIDNLIILEERRAGPLPAARIQGQLQGLEREIGSLSGVQKLVLDSGNTAEISYKQMLDALKPLPAGRLAILCFNDDAALGALRALRTLHREADAAVVGQGADRHIRDEIRSGTSSIIGSTAFMPELYGESIIDLSIKLLEGRPVPPAVYSQHMFISKVNIDDFYGDSA